MPEFTLTAAPPSVNNIYANTKNGRRKTQKYKDWIRGELTALLAQRARPVRWPVSIRIVLPAGLRGDVDNRAKACCDLLVKAGIIPDDSSRFVHSAAVSRGTTAETVISVTSLDGVEP